MRAGYLREAIALLERAQQTDGPREASELVKQAADILALVAKLTASDKSAVVRVLHGGPTKEETTGSCFQPARGTAYSVSRRGGGGPRNSQKRRCSNKATALPSSNCAMSHWAGTLARVQSFSASR